MRNILILYPIGCRKECCFFFVLSLLLPKKVRTCAFEVDYYFIDFQHIMIWIFKKSRDMALWCASHLLTNVFSVYFCVRETDTLCVTASRHCEARSKRSSPFAKFAKFAVFFCRRIERMKRNRLLRRSSSQIEDSTESMSRSGRRDRI